MKQSMEKEALRQLYLQEMGIQIWYPRFLLPHADTVREYDWLEPGATLAAESKPSEQPRPLEALQQENIRHISGKSTDKAELSGAEPDRKAASAKTVQFAFAWLAVSDSLAVICEIPYQSRGRLQAPVRSLLARILEALSVPVRPGTTPVIHFHWPLYEAQQQPTHSNQPENELLDQGIESARQTVHAFVARQLKDRPATYLLIFSEHWPDYLFPADFTSTDISGLFMHPQFAIQVLMTRGLHAMQVDDSLKKPVWKQLQPLKAQIMRLKNTAKDLSADMHNNSIKPQKDEY
jgi:hypothetical protein